MPLAITLRFDPDTALAVAHLWDGLASTGIDSDRKALGYTAHVTLAIYPDETQAEKLRSAVSRFGDEWQALPANLSGLGVFPGPPAILFAMPVVAPALLARQAALVAALDDLPVHPHYRPGHGVAHGTLSGPLRYPEAALAALLPLWRPVEAALAGIDLVRFRPVEILASQTFR